MNTTYVFVGILIMAVVTYLTRVLPMVLFRKKIENIRIRSFLYYVPYTVLAAMTFPAIFSSTNSTVASIVGCVVAIALSYFNKSLLTVAIGASGAALIIGLIGI